MSWYNPRPRIMPSESHDERRKRMKKKQKRGKRRHARQPILGKGCQRQPGGHNCRHLSPGVAAKNGNKFEVGSPAYCGGCHIDHHRSQIGLGIQRQMREAEQISVLQETETKKVRKPRTKKPAAAKPVTKKRTVKKKV